MKEKLEIIRKFAYDMGYSVNEYPYTHCKTGRPCYTIELNETCDSEGNPYTWCWYTDTEEEIL